MRRTISQQDAQKHLAEVLADVREAGDEVVIEDDGEPVAVLVPPSVYKSLQKRRDRFWKTIEKVGARNRDIPPEAVEEDLRVAIEEYRAERRSSRE